MTVKTLPWIKYSGDVDRQIEAGIRREQAARAAGTYVPRTGSLPASVRTSSQSAPAPAKDFTPSDAQLRFLNGLLVEREHSYTEAEIAEGRSDWRKIRPMLDALKVAARRPYQAPAQVETPASAPASASARLDFSAIPDGNYAIPGEVEDEIKFYRVSRNTGADGRVWTNVQARASDDLYRIPFRAGIAVLHKIVAYGLEESQMLFATKLERCWKCGRSLTDALSRSRGQGPDCWEK